MAWWREARFGLFVHFGLYATLGRHEWAMAAEGWSVTDYERLADDFRPEPGAPRAWAELARAAGMKYVVLTTRHHEGFSLWGSRANPFNSVDRGPGRDLVAELVEACRDLDLRVGLYSSLIDWHHPDCAAAPHDSAARRRFLDYTYALNEELLTNYGPVDVLWYDFPLPLETAEGWNTLEMNQRLRALQPDIVVNDRCLLPEDFGTPEENVRADPDRDWEACMTFNGLSWGYLDSEQAAPHSYTAPRILKMLATCAAGRGNLLLNIGPDGRGRVPAEAVGPLTDVGRWLAANGECAYGTVDAMADQWGVGNGISTLSRKGSTVYAWTWVWPAGGELVFSGMPTPLRSARVLATGEALPFVQDGTRIVIPDVRADQRDPIAGVTVVALEFTEEPRFVGFPTTPALHGRRPPKKG